jgi:DNA primase
MQSDESNYLTSCVEALDGRPREYLEERGLHPTTIKKYKLGYDRQRDAIVIPYLNALLEVRRFRYRNLSGSPKYIWESGGERGVHLFRVAATRKPRLWMTEGEFDAMLLSQMGFPAVAVPGAKLFKNEWRYLFAYTEQLTVVFDNDVKPDGSNPGFEGAKRVSGILGPMVNQFRMVKLPPGQDVSDLYKSDRAMLEQLVR